MFRIKWFSLIIVLVLFISSCAQVGVITGGEKDISAPKPIAEKTYPPNASLEIQPEQIQIPFNEYIQLNNPSENIRIMPNTLEVKPSIRNKTLIIELEGEYLENTTYSISFNRAIKDITENNDSLFQYVFSTGKQIDKQRASFIVKDALKNTPTPNITVGLFDNKLIKDSLILPIYLTTTNTLGKAKFNYIKAGDYFVYAYDDKDKNGTVSIGEAAGLIDMLYTIRDTIELNSEIKISEQEVPFKLSTKFISPSTLKIWSTRKLDTTQLEFINPTPEHLFFNDTLSAYYKTQNSNVIHFVYAGDTLSKRIKKEITQLRAETNLLKDKLRFNQPLNINFNDIIETINYNKILVNRKPIDSAHMNENSNQLILSFDYNHLPDSAQICILPHALSFLNLEQNDSLNYTFFKQTVKDVGNLIVVADSLFKPGILQLLLGEKVIAASKTDTSTTSVQFNTLQPNTYTFRFIEDTNKDGKWTSGDIYTGRLPENIILFSSSSKIRANWDVEAKLKFNND